jgi:hypothetical protein
MALANIMGPSLFAYAFALGISPATGWNMPGLAFWLAGSSLFLAAFITYGVARPREIVPEGSRAKG